MRRSNARLPRRQVTRALGLARPTWTRALAADGLRQLRQLAEYSSRRAQIADQPDIDRVATVGPQHGGRMVHGDDDQIGPRLVVLHARWLPGDLGAALGVDPE